MQGWEVLNENVGGRHSHLIEYYKLCKAGKKIIGKELMITLDNKINDILNPAPGQRFNLSRPHKRIDFIETKIKHFEAPFAGKPFLLTIEQKAIAEAIFGFQVYSEKYNEWLRRHKRVLLIIGRKNGKTPFAAALALAEWFCGEWGQKILCVSNDDAQASIIFDCINNFREEAVTLERVTRKNNQGIYFGNRKQRRTRGKYSKQNKGTIKKLSVRTSAQDARNIKIAIIDEEHEMKDGTTVMSVESSLSTQKDPLLFEISTEGVVIDGYLDKRLEEARKELNGESEHPQTDWLIWLYTQDSEAEVWADEQSWFKSNPMLDVVKDRDFLRGLVNKARVSGAQRAYTLAKEFNIKSSRPNAWLPDEVILNNLPGFTLDNFRGCWCIAGVDLSETIDLSAVSLLFMRPNDPTKYIHTMYFVPATKAVDPTTTESPTNPEKRNYNDWRDGGFCRVVPGNIIGDEVVADYLYEIYTTYGIRPLRAGYDEWHAKEFVKKVAKSFGDQVPVPIGMRPAVLDNATRAVENDLRAKHVNYNQNPICIWNFRNASVRHDNDGRCMPIKLQGYIGNKIDGTVSKVIAYATLRQVRAAFMAKVG